MTKYQIIVLCLLIVSILAALFEILATDKKGLMFQLHRLFGALTLLAILLIGYRAFFLIR